VAKKSDVEAAVRRTISELGGLHCVVNNAGITRDKMTKKMSEEDWDLVIAVNLKGTFLVCQAAINHMNDKKYGRISNTRRSPSAGTSGSRTTRRRRRASSGSRARSRSSARARESPSTAWRRAPPTRRCSRNVPEDIKAAIVKSIPMQRMAAPADIAAVHAFLCSDDANYVTGQLLYVDGGVTLGV